MRKALLVIVLVGAVFMAGCDFLTLIDELVDRLVNPPGTGVVGIGGVTFVEIVVEYGLEIEVMTQDTGIQPWPLVASIG